MVRLPWAWLNRYPACARTGDRDPAKSVGMTLCARFLQTLSQQKAWSP